MGSSRLAVLLCVLLEPLHAINDDIESLRCQARHCHPISRDNASWYTALLCRAPDQARVA